jgi:hypothetical protein
LLSNQNNIPRADDHEQWQQKNKAAGCAALKGFSKNKFGRSV